MIRQAKESIAKKELGKYKLTYKEDKHTIVAEPREWKWEPKVGEFYLTPDGKIRCIGNELDLENLKIAKDLNNRYVPVLDWQEIERTLEDLGYSLEFTDKGIIENYGVIIQERTKSTKTIYSGEGTSRQMAVTNALLALEKGIKNE